LRKLKAKPTTGDEGVELERLLIFDSRPIRGDKTGYYSSPISTDDRNFTL
jgi:hypothetical protein